MVRSLERSPSLRVDPDERQPGPQAGATFLCSDLEKILLRMQTRQVNSLDTPGAVNFDVVFVIVPPPLEGV